MEFIAPFLIAVAAGVSCHYIIKWLDGDHDHKDNKQPSGLCHCKNQRKIPQLYATTVGGFVLLSKWNYCISFCLMALQHMTNFISICTLLIEKNTKIRKWNSVPKFHFCIFYPDKLLLNNIFNYGKPVTRKVSNSLVESRVPQNLKLL